MPRLKEYQKEKVLDMAMDVFWEKGFTGTSISDLVEATSLNKHSMYKEFGSKEGLFLACLKNYAEQVSLDRTATLLRDPLGFRNIEDFFYEKIPYFTSPDCRSCFFVNSVIEKELLSEHINCYVEKHLLNLESSFYQCLQSAQSNGEIPKNKNIQMLAKYLMCFLQGVSVVAKTHPSEECLKQIIDEVLSHLK